MKNLLYIIFILAATGCGFSNSRPQVLDEAQRLLTTDPSAALSKLNNVDVSEFKDSATIAQWALLYSEAMVVNRLSAPTDTIVDIAIAYYAKNKHKDEFQKASRLKALLRTADNPDALATALYLQKEKEFMLYKERARREMYMSAAIFILIIATGIIAWLRQRLKLQSAQNNALMAEASGLKCQLDANRSNVSRLQSKLHGLLENRFALIDSLCQTYYESQGTKTERKAIVEKVRHEIEALSSDSFSEMEQAVDDCTDNMLVRVKKEYPAIKTEDYRLLVYLAGGLSTRTISLLLGESAEVVYKRKSRLKSRLKEHVASSCPDVMFVF